MLWYSVTLSVAVLLCHSVSVVAVLLECVMCGMVYECVEIGKDVPC